MHYWKYSVLSVIMLSVVGCSNFKQPSFDPPNKEPLQLAEPNWPAPINPCRLKSVRVESLPDGRAQVVMSWEDYIGRAKCDVDRERYILDLQSMVCFYKSNDERCKEPDAKESINRTKR